MHTQKHRTERALLKKALASDTFPRRVLATLWVDLPYTNGQLQFCLYRNVQHFQLAAQIMRKDEVFSWYAPALGRGLLVLPEHLCRYVVHVLKQLGVKHVYGIASETQWQQLQLSQFVHTESPRH